MCFFRCIDLLQQFPVCYLFNGERICDLESQNITMASTISSWVDETNEQEQNLAKEVSYEIVLLELQNFNLDVFAPVYIGYFS